MPAAKAQALPSYPVKARGVREVYITIVTTGGLVIPTIFGTSAYFVERWFQHHILSTLALVEIWLVLTLAVLGFARPFEGSNGLEHQLFQCSTCNPDLASTQMSSEMRCLLDSWQHFSTLKERYPEVVVVETWGILCLSMVWKMAIAALQGSEASWLFWIVFATFLGVPSGLPQRLLFTWIAIFRAGGLRRAVKEAKQCWILLTCLPWDVEFVQERYTASCIRIKRLQESMIR